MRPLRLSTSILAAALAVAASAQNPIISGQFSADPTARVFGGKMYVYPSHDIHSPVEKLKDWFCMADYHVFSSSDLTDWTDHGVILSQDRVPWVEPESYSMWAPDCVERDGMYYFYFPSQPKGERGFGIGVAISQSPTGPFMPMRAPIKGVMGIDPCVLIDPSGDAYMYWSGMGIRGAKLKDNMMELDGEPRVMGGLPEGFKEGPFAFERRGHYYLTYPWVEDSTETLAYSMADSPLGPFEFKGKIMEQSPTACWTNHHSIVEYDGQWYLFYHHNDYSPDMDKRRSVRVDSLFFNPDGTIRPVTPTLRGVGITDARRPIHIDRYSAISKAGAKIDFLDQSDKFAGWKTIFDKKGGWVRYNSVDFGKEAPTQVKVKAKSPSGATLRISQGNKAVADVKVAPCTAWTFATAPVGAALQPGVGDVTVTLVSGKGVEVDYIGFDAVPWHEGAFRRGKYRNIFAEVGYPQKEIDRRLQQVFDDLFFGPDRVYFEVGDSLGYISDIKNHDVRTEGQSYGMMAAVQFDRKDIFDRIWRWSKKYMQHHDGPRKGYFAWSCQTDGKRNAEGPASDGELYYVTSLIFASNRWGNDGDIDYLSEARHILDCSMTKLGMDEASPLIDPATKLITFTPDKFGGSFTDPSYHLPAFYEVWAQWAGDGRSEFWKECARVSRDYLHRAVHPQTGLTPDYSNFDGSPMTGGPYRRFGLGTEFHFDSWRVPMNVALDYSWSCADKEWQQAYADRIQGFLYSQGIDDFIDQYNLDGTPADHPMAAGGKQALRHSLGLVATSAAASIAATHPRSREFVKAIWEAKHEPYADGYFDAYYDGFMRLFAFMHLSGNYRIITPQHEIKN